MRLIKVEPSSRTDKKYQAIFLEDDGKHKKVHFGARGYDDFTLTNDIEQRERYLKRHSDREKWNNPITPGALSRWILWNKPTLTESIMDYKKRFNL